MTKKKGKDRGRANFERIKNSFQPKRQLEQTSYIKRLKLFLFLPCNKHLINQAKWV